MATPQKGTTMNPSARSESATVLPARRVRSAAPPRSPSKASRPSNRDLVKAGSDRDFRVEIDVASFYLDRRGAAHEFCDLLAQAGDRIQDRAAAVRAYWRPFPEPVRQAFWPDLKALLLEKGLFNARDVEEMREEDAGPDRKPGAAPGAGPSGEGGGAG